ncbi:hypothetical protein GCM10009678_15880 [Actinomadura kijaniata]|uniref:Lipoprotein n=1 Tax=Actinomadura namibiensis TaxID=182080 RepID=A0A7W3LIS1_ACTNM|nr:hypothetical protein [Actinomadura namibiensis]MBA8948934.1 hypothetical protein [Actinomadura namibiensis]
MAGPSARLRNATSRGIAAAVAGAALTACGPAGDGGPETTPLPDRAPTASPAPTAAPTALVLRWRTLGGIAGLGEPGGLPDFSLYGDGRAVTAERGALREYRLRPEALRRLLDEARAAGLDRSRTAGDHRIPDALTLEFVMGGARVRIAQPEAAPGDPAVRFRKRLDPRAWPDGDQAAPPRPYVPRRVAVLTGEDPAPDARPWPLPALGGGERLGGAACRVYTGADAGKAASLARTAKPADRWRSRGGTYSVRFRPLLPDETTCRDLARP